MPCFNNKLLLEVSKRHVGLAKLITINRGRLSICLNGDLRNVIK